ncbi:MAG: hypothetical protein U0893_21405 [Chloroflexota bacterium]
MVALRVGSIELGTLDDAAFASVLDAASEVGGPASFPTLFGLTASDEPIDPWLLVDELARLSATEPGQRVGVLVGTLRDDLMSAVAAADEG